MVDSARAGKPTRVPAHNGMYDSLGGLLTCSSDLEHRFPDDDLVPVRYDLHREG